MSHGGGGGERERERVVLTFKTDRMCVRERTQSSKVNVVRDSFIITIRASLIFSSTTFFFLKRKPKHEDTTLN